NLCPFDLNTAGLQARTKSVPVLAADYTGRFYLAFASRHPSDCLTGPSQIMMTSSTDGVTWTPPNPVDPVDATKTPPAHQFQPAIAVGGQTVQVAWVDFRNDAYRVGTGTPNPNIPPEQPGGINDRLAFIAGGARHTAEIFGAQMPIGPLSLPAVQRHKISEFTFGSVKGASSTQLNFNVWNIRQFAKMSVPFNSDYGDV